MLQHSSNQWNAISTPYFLYFQFIWSFFFHANHLFHLYKSIIFSKSCLLDTAWNDSFVTTSGMVLSWVKVHHQEALFQEVSCSWPLLQVKSNKYGLICLRKKFGFDSVTVISHLYPPIFERRTNLKEWMAHLNDECRAKVRYYFVTALFKTREFCSSKANWRLRFSLPSITLADLLGNCVSVFQGSLLVIVIDSSEKPTIAKTAFEPLEFACLWKAQ